MADVGLSRVYHQLNIFIMETYRSGHNENDSKSFWRDERHVGSNPTVSARKAPDFSGAFVFMIIEYLSVGENPRWVRLGLSQEVKRKRRAIGKTVLMRTSVSES